MKKVILVLLFVFSVFTAEAKKYQYELAIGAIFRDEAPFLREWIEFHKIVGVQHFYLYNNVSQDNYLSVLQPYIDSGDVELIDWPYEDNTFNGFCLNVQPQAYEDCIERAKKKVRWLALIDTDEFLTPVKKNTVTSVLKGYKKYAGVSFNWQLFGTSNVPFIPENKTMIESLRLKAAPDYYLNRLYKSIVRPDYVEGCTNPHFVNFKNKYYAVDARKRRMDKTRDEDRTAYLKPLVINHYWTGPEDRFYGRKLVQYKNWNPDVDYKNFQERDKPLNEIHDLLAGE